MKLTAYANAGGFLDVAEKSLLVDEARNNLILGVADRVCAGRSYGDEPPYFLTVEEDGTLVVAAIRTPPFPLIVHCAEGRLDALDRLIDHLRTADPGLPGVNGETEVAAAFADRWTKESDGRVEVGMRMRVYVLYGVDPPMDVPGRSAGDEEQSRAEGRAGPAQQATPTGVRRPDSCWTHSHALVRSRADAASSA